MITEEQLKEGVKEFIKERKKNPKKYKLKASMEEFVHSYNMWVETPSGGLSEHSFPHYGKRGTSN